MIYDNIIYKQILGTAMGTPVAVVYSNLTLAYLEQPIFSLNPVSYNRYIDDLFIICDREDQNKYIECFNSRCPQIQLDPQSITIASSGIFLDLKVSLDYNNGNVITELYQKPINKYMYIPPTSAHPKHVFTNFIQSEIQRVILNNSCEVNLKQLLRLFFKRLTNRGYHKHFINTYFVNRPTRLELIQQLLHKTSDPTIKQKRDQKLIFILKTRNPTLKLPIKSLLKLPDFLLEDRIFSNIFDPNILCIKTFSNKLQTLLCNYSVDLTSNLGIGLTLSRQPS
jgi:hypothetical protein